MARTNWTDHPTAYRAHITTTATDPVSKEPLLSEAFYGPYGAKAGAKGQATAHANYRKKYGTTDRWMINGKWVEVDDWEVVGVVEHLTEYGKWEEV